MYLTLLTFLHVAVCVLLILIVLLQHGRGADMGATFGGGSNTLFGASGADNLLTRVTTVLAGLFMALSVCLASSLNSGNTAKSSLFENLPASTAPASTAPASNATNGTQNSAAEKTIDVPAVPAEAPKTPDAQQPVAAVPASPVAATGTENNSSTTTAPSNSTGNNNAVVVDANAVAKQATLGEPAAGSPLANEKAVTDSKPLADVVPQAAPNAAPGNAPEGSASKK